MGDERRFDNVQRIGGSAPAQARTTLSVEGTSSSAMTLTDALPNPSVPANEDWVPEASVLHSGSPWSADEDAQCVRFHRNHHQVFKAPKQGTPYAEYWPSPDMIAWMLSALNAAEARGENPTVPC